MDIAARRAERETRKAQIEARKAELAAEAPAVRDRITAAGIKYPSYWDEMGRSEKDIWEDRMLRAIERGKASRANSSRPGIRD